MDSSAHTVPLDSEIVKENKLAALSEIVTKNVSRADSWIRQRTLSLLTPKQSPKLCSAYSKIVTETASRCDAWICQPINLNRKESRKTESLPTQKSSPILLLNVTHGFVSQHSPYWLGKSHGKLSRCHLRNHHRNCFKSWPMDSLVPTAPLDSEIVKENREVALSEIDTKNVSKAEACIPQRTLPLFTHKESRKKESLPTQKSSPKLLRDVTHGFVSPHSPYWLG